MTVTSIRFALAAGLLPIAVAAHADFRAALADYNAGRYEVAHQEFLKLAELGDCSSQFNLGAMALKGQGGPKDAGSGVGWLRAAAGNGCQQLVGNMLADREGRLDAGERRAAGEIVARYGRDALHAEGIVDPDFTCRTDTPASVLESPAPEYPPAAGGVRRPALVITVLTIGVDGLARDPEILLSLPGEGFAAAAVEAWMNSRFAPALRAGAPVESRLQAKLVWGVDRGSGLAGIEALRRARERADAGDAEGAYLAGLAATLDASLGISSTRGAQLTLAADLLAGAPSPAQVAKARALLEQAAGADGFYVRKHVAALLAASPLEAVRDPDTALRVALKLAAGEIQSDPQMFETVAAAYAASGDFGHATASERMAIRKAAALAWNTDLMKQRLAEYRAGRAWRGELLASPLAGGRGAR
jgi:Gram-negative bacterial TonB protein C-terminal